MSLLAIEHLTVRYGADLALADVSLRVGAGEIVGLVGRSGSGKSTLAAAALALLPADVEVAGAIRIDGTDLATLDADALRRVRGRAAAIVFQEPATALNPALTIGRQIGEVLAAHRVVPRDAVAGEVRRLLSRVGLDVAPDRYPHMLSGGQRQRVAVAVAMAGRPRLLIADEPTAALDPRARDAIVALLVGLVREEDMALLLVSHDLAMVARVADRIAVLDRGRVVEDGSLPDRLRSPASAALAAMVAAEAMPAPPRPPVAAVPLLTIRGLVCSHRAGGGLFDRRRAVALSGVDLDLAPGETLAVVGPSGSGKTTLARAILGLDRPDAGTIVLDGLRWDTADRPGRRALRRRVQAVFQDPADSLDPMQTVEHIVAEPLGLFDPPPRGAARRATVIHALEQVGLDASAAARRPHAFSGGQRQRVALARALAIRPKLVVMDEALSALDPESRADMAALLERLQAELGLAYLFISHDPALVRRLAHRVLTLEDGRLEEQTPLS